MYYKLEMINCETNQGSTQNIDWGTNPENFIADIAKKHGLVKCSLDEASAIIRMTKVGINKEELEKFVAYLKPPGMKILKSKIKTNMPKVPKISAPGNIIYEDLTK